MENRQKILRIEPSEWSEGAARLLADAVTPDTLPAMAAAVESGAARLFAIWHGGELGCLFVLRVDRCAAGDEGVIVAASGGVRGLDLTAECLPTIEGLFSGVVAVRIHTMRPGLAKKLVRMGYQSAEIVLRKKIK